MTKEQTRLVDKALGQITRHAIAAKKGKRPYDVREVRDYAATIEEIAHVLKESLDVHMGASAVLASARAGS